VNKYSFSGADFKNNIYLISLMSKSSGLSINFGGGLSHRQDSPMADEMFDGQVRIINLFEFSFTCTIRKDV
jgi:hypothetical protein